MKKACQFLLVSILLLSACAPVVQQSAPGVETIVASTLQALTATAPTALPTATPPSGTVVTFEYVSFIIPEGLALGVNAQVVPAAAGENTAPWDVAPEHLLFEFYGYNDQVAKSKAMEIQVFPAKEYSSMNVGAGISLPKLQSFLAAPDQTLDADQLPAVPYYNAAQMFAAQVKLIPFASGSGVRMMTQYGQAVGPAANSATLYHFQGLTSDGKYYIIATLPLGASILINGGDPLAVPPAGGVQFPGYTTLNPDDYGSYFQAVTSALNNAELSTFSPTLETLDSLIESITISTP